MRPRPGSPPPLARDYSSSNSEDDEEDTSGTYDPFSPDLSGSDNDGYTDEGNTHGHGGNAFERNSVELHERRLNSVDRGLSTSHRNGGKKKEVEDYSDAQRSPSHGSDNDVHVPSETAAGQRGKRATMDVDAFKRLLLTGDAGTGPDSNIPFRSGLHITPNDPTYYAKSLDDVFNIPNRPTTDSETTNSLSLSEADAFHSESSRKSSLPSEQREERRGSAATSHEKKKPPPPKTRHGKPIKDPAGPTSPTTASQSLSLDSHSPTSTSPSFTSVSTNYPTKPLPRHPSDNFSTSSSSRHGASQSEAQSVSPPHHKRAPTPPLSRRHSQMKPNRSDHTSKAHPARLPHPPSNSGLTSLSSQSSSPNRTPPPPPSRRLDREFDTHFPLDWSANTLHLIPQGDGGPEKQKSNAPSGDDLSKRLSITGLEHKPTTNSVKQVSRTSSTRSSHAPPPKPPPPRRTGTGSRASLDGGAHSPGVAGGRSFSGPSGSSSHGKDEPESSHSSAKDILADLSRLQKEVDDLRGQYEGRKPSH